MALRFGYTLMRVRPADDGTHYDDVAVEEFAVDSDDELRERKLALHSWATALLADLRPELSLYYAVYSTLDEDGNTGWPFGTEHIVWDETHEVVPSRWELQRRASSSDRSASATRPGAVAAASR
jgi:hypothetical protein